MKRRIGQNLAILGLLGAMAAAPVWSEKVNSASGVPDKVRLITTSDVGGILGERLALWRQRRLWRVARDPFLLDGFQSPPGSHPWQGEHVGKWLHAATLAYDATNDPQLGQQLHEIVEHLVAAQHDNGYLGTYAEGRRFYDRDDRGAKWSWDVWTHRYLLYGLLTYDQSCPDPAAVAACERMGDLLSQTFGPGGRDITEIGTRHGLSSACLLESIVMLYARTGRPRYLELAKRIVEQIEHNPELRITGAMREGLDVSVPGDGKAYQLMATLLGYARLYRATGQGEYLAPAVTAWENILRGHLYQTGGPWSLKTNAANSDECFTDPCYFHPTNCVETCSTTTWVQLSLLLWEITGQAKYAREAERAVLNHLMGAQSPNGNDWGYFTMPNQPDRGYKDEITCCASSGPRALEEMARHLLGVTGDGAIVINSYLPLTATVPFHDGSSGELHIEGDYPWDTDVTLRLETTKPQSLVVDLLWPAGTASLTATVNGSRQTLKSEKSGYVRLTRTWKPGDEVRLHFEFPLKAHFHTASDSLRWVCFSRGPIVLAQDVSAQADQPQVVLSVDSETDDGARWLKPIAAPLSRPPKRLQQLGGGFPVYRLTGDRKIMLVPYYLAGSQGGAVRTMFPTRKPKSK